jgi:putative ABC transport system ATP-binding protein
MGTNRPATTLATSGLTKTYGTGAVAIHALRGIDLAFAESELVVLLGPSGSGKSTLLNLLGGLDTPSEGSVTFRGAAITAFGDRALTRYRRDHVGFVFQFYNLIPGLTAEENVALVTEIAQDPMAPREALDMVGLGDRASHFPAELSSGEQQRVAIARAIAKRPDILLCDEPTGALDSATGLLVLDAIDRVNRELGTTTVLITHNVAIAGMAHRVVSLADGRVVEDRRNATRLTPSQISW